MADISAFIFSLESNDKYSSIIEQTFIDNKVEYHRNHQSVFDMNIIHTGVFLRDVEDSNIAVVVLDSDRIDNNQQEASHHLLDKMYLSLGFLMGKFERTYIFFIFIRPRDVHYELVNYFGLAKQCQIIEIPDPQSEWSTHVTSRELIDAIERKIASIRKIPQGTTAETPRLSQIDEQPGRPTSMGSRREQLIIGETPQLAPSTSGASMRVFCSYSHRDDRYRRALKSHLALLEVQGHIQEWNDHQIGAGREWEKHISENLEAADIILLLVSSDFFASKYAYEKEMKRALEKHDAGEARVIPIIIRSANWHTAPFGKLQPLPTSGLPITSWHPQDEGWVKVEEGIRKSVEELQLIRTRRNIGNG